MRLARLQCLQLLLQPTGDPIGSDAAVADIQQPSSAGHAYVEQLPFLVEQFLKRAAVYCNGVIYSKGVETADKNNLEL